MKAKPGSYFYYDYNTMEICFITDESNELQKRVFDEKERLPYHWANKNYFKGYEEDNLESLIKFKKDYNDWVDEIKRVLFYTDEGKKYRLNPKHYKNLKTAVRKIVFNFSKISEKECKSQIDNIDKDEYLILSNCYNAGLMTADSEKVNVPMDIYGYDFTSMYPDRQSFISIPKSRGKKIILDKLDFNKLECGVYRVQINYSNPKFKLLFGFSQENHYHSSTLRNIYKHKELFGLSFKLLDPDEDYSYNAYIYVNSEFVNCSEIFGEWFISMQKIRAQCSKTNQLIKYLISSSWGVLTESKKIQIGFDEIEKYDTDNQYYYKETNEKGHILIDYNDIAYSKGLYRIKQILTASVRNFIMNYAIKNEIINKIVRIHTDSYMLSSPQEFNVPKNKCKRTNEIIKPKPEAKSTGYIKIYNSQRYVHICKKCNVEYKYNPGENHFC